MLLKVPWTAHTVSLLCRDVPWAPQHPAASSLCNNWWITQERSPCEWGKDSVTTVFYIYRNMTFWAKNEAHVGALSFSPLDFQFSFILQSLERDLCVYWKNSGS